jgi:hypothetical protein
MKWEQPASVPILLLGIVGGTAFIFMLTWAGQGNGPSGPLTFWGDPISLREAFDMEGDHIVPLAAVWAAHLGAAGEVGGHDSGVSQALVPALVSAVLFSQYPSQARTGNPGYRGKRGSLNDSRQRMNVEPLDEGTN